MTDHHRLTLLLIACAEAAVFEVDVNLVVYFRLIASLDLSLGAYLHESVDNCTIPSSSQLIHRHSCPEFDADRSPQTYML
jgi:hypothetical protein